ncbi:multicopper oxidase family protein [Streptacidiphilus griseoplanus]|uniref:multicopper oxidase family protein n=1 Tax=Peterkaempfera griseoplana TaxID=66896 RepID=UPI0007C65CA0|nr:multicopper oxidase domain-containing protein [Peterkaempfera griseoplana]
MSRRRFIAGMATAASALAGASALALSEGTARAAGNRLPVPELLVPTQQGGVTVFALRAARATWQLLPDVTSGSAGFNGPYLGPTLRVRNGQRVRFEVTNGLDEDLAVHWHGAHVPPQDDGGVHAAFGPGQVWKPEFTVKQQAATLWYHPHTMGITARQIAQGLAGMLIVQDDSAASRALPGTYGTDDVPVILQSVAVGPDGGIRYESGSFSEPGMAFPLVVNGVAVDDEPLTFTASTGRVRLRLLNASLSETLTVRRMDGGKLTQVATESAFLNRPTQVAAVRMPAGARAEVVVDVTRETVLETMVETGVGRRRDSRQSFLTLLPGSGGGGRRTALPARLNTIHRYDVSHLRPRVIALTENGGMLGINGVSGTTMKAMDAHEIVVREGDLELWEVVNRSPRNHSFHVHDVPFQVISVNGRPPTGVDLGWRDTIAVHRGARVRIAMRFTDYASDKYTYMLHCHMAEHEDLGMMTSLKVRPR